MINVMEHERTANKRRHVSNRLDKSTLPNSPLQHKRHSTRARGTQYDSGRNVLTPSHAHNLWTGSCDRDGVSYRTHEQQPLPSLAMALSSGEDEPMQIALPCSGHVLCPEGQSSRWWDQSTSVDLQYSREQPRTDDAFPVQAYTPETH